MIIEERYRKILDIVKEKRTVSYAELASLLYCSMSTARRDVEAMSQRNLIEKVHNGAAYIEGNASESPSLIRESEHVREKRAIAALAKRFVTPGITMFLDSSTTCAQLIPYMNGIPNLVAITNGLENALLLSTSGVEVYMPGGMLFPRNNAITGAETLAFLSRYAPDVFFFSTRGLSLDGRLSEGNDSTRATKGAMLRKAKRKILLIDSSKFDKTFFAESGTLADVDVLVTDAPLPESLQALCDSLGVEVLIPE